MSAAFCEADEWMDDPEAQARFQSFLESADRALQPLQDAFDRSEQLSAADYAYYIGPH